MESVETLLTNNESWLMERTLEYANQAGYTKYTSTLLEAWRISIQGLSKTITHAYEQYPELLKLGPDEKYAANPIANFGVIEAQRHRGRGVPLVMFLGLTKYYKQSYLDLVTEKSTLDASGKMFLQTYIDRCFDFIELGYIEEWTRHDESIYLNELQVNNRAMTNEKNKYLTVFESMYDAVILFNAEHKIENLNYAAKKLLTDLKFPGSNYYGCKLDDLPASSLMEELRLRLLESASSEKDFETQIEINKKTYHLHVKMQPMLDVSKKFAGTVVSFNDLTKFKSVECERIRLQQQLFQSERLASIGVLASGIAHEINNPLSIIKGFVSMLTKRLKVADPRDSDEKTINTINDAITRIAVVVDSIGACAQHEGGRTELLDINQVIYDVFAFSQHITKDHDIEITQNLSSEAPRIRGDFGKIKQVLINFLTNARDALQSRPSGRQITIETRTEGAAVIISFSDNGCGIPEGSISRVFDLFFTSKDVGKGTGLGLAINRAIIESLDGSLHVSSREGEGTTFFVTLPRSKYFLGPKAPETH